MIANFRRLMKADEQEEAVWDLLEAALCWWNITDPATGGPLAVTPESIRATPLFITTQVAYAITNSLGEALTPVTTS
jgi:hypothetical protein